MRTILFATNNLHKVEEANAILKDCGYTVVPTNAPKLEIQSEDLVEIAVYAAVTAYSMLREPVVVEDAGLFIEALNGFPGPYSSYVYKTIGVHGILKLLKDIENRKAYFESIVALAHASGVVVFRGRVQGMIAESARGTHGFGFDPIFIPEGSTKTFAEMNIEEKNMYSHRARAFRRLCEWLRNNSV